MGLKYKITDQSEIYFVTFTVVGWADVFIRDNYREIFIESVAFCQKNKGLLVYAWVIMTSHVHMIIGTDGRKELEYIIRDLKSFTSRHIRLEMEAASYESRNEWLLPLFYRAGLRNKNNKDFQFWIQDNHPIMLATGEMCEQRLNYVHNNPVVAGFVTEAHHWKWSSAYDYQTGRPGLLDIIFLM